MASRSIDPLGDGILFGHYTELPSDWWRWRYFTPEELACRHCGELFFHPRSFDALETARIELGHPLPTYGHRCWLHNACVGGRPRSAHLKFAADVATVGRDRVAVFHALARAGFRSFGGYDTFIHADLRPDDRRWFGGAAARDFWLEHFTRPVPGRIDVDLAA